MAIQVDSDMDATSQLADRIAEVAPFLITASIAQTLDSASLLQKIEDLSRQVAALSSARTRHRSLSKDRRKENDAPSMATAPRIAVIAVCTGDSGTKRESAHHSAPTTGRETAATGVNGGRRMFHTHRTLIHRRKSKLGFLSTAFPNCACFPESLSQDARSAPATIFSRENPFQPTGGTPSRSTCYFQGISPGDLWWPTSCSQFLG